MTAAKGPRTVPNWPDILQENPRNYVSVKQLRIEKALRRTKKPAPIVPVARPCAH
jgi:hypothetical protein